MTETEAAEIVGAASEGGDEFSVEELAEMFSALYGRRPDKYDDNCGVWSLICAGVSIEG